MKTIKHKHIGEIMQKIYDSEICLRMGWIYDGGLDFLEGTKSPDIWRGLECTLVRASDEDDMSKAFEVMCKHLVAVYPKSSFSKWFIKKFR